MPVQDQLNGLVAHLSRVHTEALLATGNIRLYVPHTTPHDGASATTHATIIDAGGGAFLEAFHKPAASVNVNLASHYGHDWDEPQLHDAAAWVVAKSLGEPFVSLVCICTVRDIQGQSGSISAKKPGPPPHAEDVPGILAALPDQVDAAAFFDVLTGQQDRHLGNYRYDATLRRVGLIDHGFAFTRPVGPRGHPDHFNASLFAQTRHGEGRAHLTDLEVALLDTVIHSPDAIGLADVVASERLDAFVQRAHRMRSVGQLLSPGDW